MKSAKKIASLVLVLCIMAAVAIPAYAAEGDLRDGTAVTSSEGSNHAATVVLDDQGATTSVTNDDDALAGANDTNGADIYVFAKVLDTSTKIYKVDIAWGAMKFQFTSAADQWNPETHAYTPVTGDTGWALTGYVDGTNNKVTVTNHSNDAIDATFEYIMDATAFNNAATGADNVVGNFFADNAKAVAAAEVLAAVETSVTNKLVDSKISLHTADAYSTVENPADATNNVTAGPRETDVFFAFSGTPDQGKGATLNDFKKVGVITVTIAPNDAMADEYPAFVAAP